MIRIKPKPQNSESATSKTYIKTEFNKMQNKKFLAEFPGKLGIFAVILKTMFRIKPKPQNSESATSKTYIETELNKMQNKKFLAEFPGRLGIFAVILKTMIRIKPKPQNSETATLTRKPLFKPKLQKRRKTYLILILW